MCCLDCRVITKMSKKQATVEFGEDETRLVGGGTMDEDQKIELSLRPQYLREYIGQKKVKDNRNIFVKAALARSEALDHVLLNGPPGLGKTTLAGIISREMGSQLKVTAGPVIEKAGDLAALL